MAERILGAFDADLGMLARAGVGDLRRIAGVGEATAARIVAALELGRRTRTDGLMPGVPIRGPADVARLMSPSLAHLRQEEFHALLLDRQHRLRKSVLVTRGTLDASLIHAREVFRPAILESAAAVILVHNHPSGDPTPSAEDRSVTRQLRRAGEQIGIPILDHVIIGASGWASVEGEVVERGR
jgi:DNA repair protein RadC